ncbi:hypothetical protein DNK06_00800 [Pseudomonas daroniae]|uniref:Uncharacterized protein n=1 Tax=Phytopseudomonas daroniae TaxID=2487519 RepID=A0A4V2KBE5_9GAMM|nr:hypothetical protein DNK31_10155 [Pseudomonas sp. FRB 228]TBU83964.1 hypothetical protein DNK06_00800 [Pseudomonas daroniae]TBU93142.1 hypothetical protein DNJ99_06710 [Pseudomonas daroniae]
MRSIAPRGGESLRVCFRFSASRVAARNGLRLGAGRREWLFPCQVLQRQRRSFPAQPAGPGQFLRDAALLDGSFGPPNFTSRALPRAKTGSGAAVRETGTDPRFQARSQSQALHRSASTCRLRLAAAFNGR